MKMRVVVLRAVVFMVCFFVGKINAGVIFTTVNQSPEEEKTKADLEVLHTKYDLTPWIYTRNIRIDKDAKTPRSHPVLTMSTQKEYLESRIKLLSTYLHEQFHWHVVINGKPSKEAFRLRIKEVFPNVKVGYPYGSRDEGSTLSHIMVCYLEYLALSDLIGQEKAVENVSTNGYYTWVYETVTNPSNKKKLDDLVSEFGLGLFSESG